MYSYKLIGRQKHDAIDTIRVGALVDTRDNLVGNLGAVCGPRLVVLIGTSRIVTGCAVYQQQREVHRIEVCDRMSEQSRYTPKK